MKSKKVGSIDYGAGNISSIFKILIISSEYKKNIIQNLIGQIRIIYKDPKKPGKEIDDIMNGEHTFLFRCIVNHLLLIELLDNLIIDFYFAKRSQQEFEGNVQKRVINYSGREHTLIENSILTHPTWGGFKLIYHFNFNEDEDNYIQLPKKFIPTFPMP